MANQQLVDQLSEKISKVMKLDIAGLTSNNEWGSVNFKASVGNLNDIVAMVKPLGSLPIRILPDGPAQDINSQLDSFLQVIAKIEGFSLQGNAEENRNAIQQEVKNHVPRLYNAIAPHAAYLALYAGDLDRTIQTLDQTRKEANGEVESLKNFVKDSKLQVEEIMQSAREAAGSAGVGAFSSDFSDQADRQDEEAKFWLICASALGLVSIGAALGSYFLPISADSTPAQIVQLTTSKVVVLGLLLSATYWSSRQFRALRHQIAVNRHRANALKTFQAFVKAAADDNTRDAVLMETTRSIFAIAPSGYLTGQSEPSTQDGLKIVEMIRGSHPGD